MNMNPAAVASARTARLAREARTPVYTSETGKPRPVSKRDRLTLAEFQASVRDARMRDMGICTCEDC